ncbi:hypothetical protein CMK14_11615 [Candidatus Poribacteria bacterium]|nr:hypothetical protein [Candidatus Poribacteria bacterium]
MDTRAGVEDLQRYSGLQRWEGLYLYFEQYWPGGIPVAAQVFAIDSGNGELLWTFDGGGGLTGPVVGNNGRVYFGSTVNSCFFCVDANGNGDGTTDLLWAVRMGKQDRGVGAGHLQREGVYTELGRISTSNRMRYTDYIIVTPNAQPVLQDSWHSSWR